MFSLWVRSILGLWCVVTAPALDAAPTSKPAAKPTTHPMAASQPGATSKPSVLRFPTWGLEFVPPAGWSQLAEGDLTIVGQWLMPPDQQGAISVVVTPILDRSVRDYAEALTAQFGGTIKDTTLDNRPAKWVEGGKDGQAAVITQRDGYLVEVRSVTPGGKTTEMEVMRKSWKWTDVESPARHPEPRAERVGVLDEMTILFPLHMRPWRVPFPPGRANFAAIDVTAQRLKREFQVDISMPPEIQGQPLERIMGDATKQLTARFAMIKPVQWRLVAGMKDRVISETMMQTPAELSEKPHYGEVAALVALDNTRRVWLSFSMSSEREENRFAYSTMAENITASVAPIMHAGGPPATAPAP